MSKLIKRLTALVTAALVAAVPASMPAYGAEEAAEKTVSLRVAAYYDGEGNLVSVKRVGEGLTPDETEVYVNLYDPTDAVTAKVFAWTAELEPVEDSAVYSLDRDNNSVVILHTNDMHGSLAGSSSVIGSDRVAALKKLENAVLADSGDAAQGVALASQSKGTDIIKIMNAAGYDVMALGNHEFDYGQEQLGRFRELAEFPMISANTYLDGKPLCASDDNNGENVIIEKNGVKVGIFALTTRATATSTKPENLEGIEFKDEIETAKAQVEKLDEEGADVIVALTHMGVLESGACTGRELAKAMKDTELDAIIDGHSHTVVNEVVEGTDITLAQTGTGSANVGRMELSVDADGSVTVDETMLSRAFFENIAPDPEVAAVIDELNGELSETLKQPIGTAVNTLWGGSVNGKISESRSGETNLGDLICDAMIAEAADIMPADKKDLPIVAIENGGGFRTAIPNGAMTLGSVINCLPFANAVMTKEITPAVLYSALESFVSSVTAQDKESGFLTASYSGSFPQIGGMSFVYDPNAETGSKLTSLTLSDGTALDRGDDKTKIILVSNDYVIGNAAFANCPAVAEGSGLTETVLAHIDSLTAGGTKPLELPVTEGRIKTVNNDENRKYTARFAIKGNGVPAELTAIVDGKDNVSGKVTDGVLELELPDGPHAVKLYPDQQEVYVNNYSGNGTLEDYGSLHLGWPELEYSGK